MRVHHHGDEDDEDDLDFYFLDISEETVKCCVFLKQTNCFALASVSEPSLFLSVP